ncbi:unnamed protein product [Blepharisma stoltei]|uniref:Uncharacterized protein n=1 Tax=Blepharisma stoltei TaxID=1481888 RepID=A0AAU9K2B4_9CILI|nr:unnamed protein product [Blepharisma stoltei]
MSMDDFWQKVIKVLSGSEKERKDAIDELVVPPAEEWQKQVEDWRNEILKGRKKFLLDYSLEQRNAIFFCSAAAVFLFSGGIFRRFRKTISFSIIGGIFIVPEHFRPYI